MPCSMRSHCSFYNCLTVSILREENFQAFNEKERKNSSVIFFSFLSFITFPNAVIGAEGLSDNQKNKSELLFSGMFFFIF